MVDMTMGSVRLSDAQALFVEADKRLESDGGLARAAVECCQLMHDKGIMPVVAGVALGAIAENERQLEAYIGLLRLGYEARKMGVVAL